MKKVILLFFLSLVGLSIGYFLSHSYECGYSIFCYNLFSRVGHPLLYGMGPLAIVFALLLVFPTAFNAWRNFALWFLPPVIDIFATYKGPGNGFMDFTPYPVEVYRWFGELYIGLSVAIIAVSVLRRKFGKASAPKVSSKTRQIVFWTVWICYVAVIIGWHFFD